MDKKEFALKQHEEWQGKLEIACRAKVKTPRGSGCCLYSGRCRTLPEDFRGYGSLL